MLAEQSKSHGAPCCSFRAEQKDSPDTYIWQCGSVDLFSSKSKRLAVPTISSNVHWRALSRNRKQHQALPILRIVSWRHKDSCFREIFYRPFVTYLQDLPSPMLVDAMPSCNAIFSLVPIALFRRFQGISYQVAIKLGKKQKEYDNSKLSVGRWFISQGLQIASLVYFVEAVTTFLVAILAGMSKAAAPVKSPQQVAAMEHLLPLQKCPELFANCAYGIWIARKVVLVKSWLLNKLFPRLPDPETYDWFLDFLVYLAAAIFVLDASSFDMGALVKSLVAVGGLSSIVICLALKESVAQLPQGALLMAANKQGKCCGAILVC
jgi:hypothetical protein